MKLISPPTFHHHNQNLSGPFFPSRQACLLPSADSAMEQDREVLLCCKNCLALASQPAVGTSPESEAFPGLCPRLHGLRDS